MASEMRYARQKYMPKRQRLSSKNLKREAESISYESLLKRQRIYSADNNSVSEHVRVSKRILNNAALHTSKSIWYYGQPHLLNLLKRDPPESLDKRRKTLKLHKKKRFRRTSTYHMHVSGSHLFKKKEERLFLQTLRNQIPPKHLVRIRTHRNYSERFPKKNINLLITIISLRRRTEASSQKL